MNLRPYQQESLDAFESAVSGDVRRPLIVLPTGAGKTVIFSRLAKRPNGKKTLAIAHRKELINQAASKIKGANPDLWVEVEQADRVASPMANVVVASVQTIGREGSPRLTKFRPEDFDLIIIDEAHHAVAESYRTIIDHFGCFEPGGPILLGVTATPNRGGNEEDGLGAIFQKIIYQKSIIEMIEEGWLAPIRAFTVSTKVSIADVHTSKGDFAQGELEQAINTEDRNLQIVRSWMELAKGRTRTLAFTAGVAHAHDLAAMFRAHDVPCGVVTGKTPDEDRANILKAFDKAVLPVLANMGVLTEGYDCPGIDCILWGRPTKSMTLLAQSLGRGTRLHPGKDDLLFLDFVDTTGKHKIATVASLFGMPPKLKMKSEKVTDVAKRVEEIQREFPSLALDEEELSLAQLEKKVTRLRELAKREAIKATVSATEVALFAHRKVDPFVARHSGLAWVKTGENVYDLPIQGAQRIRMTKDLLGQFEVTVLPEKQPIGTFAQPGDAFGAAAEWVTSKVPDKMKLLDQGAKWRSDPASEGQIRELKKRSVPIPPGLTKGEAANMLNAIFAKKTDDWDGEPTPGQKWFLRQRGISVAGLTKKTASMKIQEIKRGAAA